MLAMLGMYVQALVTSKGPVSNWLEHLADPSSANGFAFATKFAPTLLARSPADGSETLLRKPCSPPRARFDTRTITESPPSLEGSPLSEGPSAGAPPLRTSMSGCPADYRSSQARSLVIWEPGRRPEGTKRPSKPPSKPNDLVRRRKSPKGAGRCPTRTRGNPSEP